MSPDEIIIDYICLYVDNIILCCMIVAINKFSAVSTSTMMGMEAAHTPST